MTELSRISRRRLLGSAIGIGAASLIGGTVPARAQQPVDRPATQLPARANLIVRGAYVLTIDPALGDLPRGDVHIRDGAIVAVGTDLVAPEAEVIDGRGRIVLPGFVDTHWHLWTSSLRALVRNDAAADLGYFAISPRVGLAYTPEDTYRAVRLGLVEGLYSGITTVHDWSHNILGPAYADANLRALSDVGIRGRFSYGYSRRLQLEPEQPMDIADVARVQREWFSRPGDGLLSMGMASRGVDLGQGEATPLRVLRRDWDGARGLGVPITLHVGRAREVTVLEQEGLLGPDVQLVHPTRTTDAERKILAARGTSFSLSPHTEVRRLREAGDAQLAELLAAGVQVGLSVDHIAGLNCDFFSQMRVLHWMHSHRIGDKVPITTRRLVELATIDGARSLGLADKIGSLTPGKRADLILVRATDINMVPMTEPTHALVFTAQPRNVETVVVDGRILLRDGRFTALDEAQVAREASESARALHKRAGWP